MTGKSISLLQLTFSCILLVIWAIMLGSFQMIEEYIWVGRKYLSIQTIVLVKTK